MSVSFWNYVMVLNLVGDSMAILGSVYQPRVASEIPKCQKRIVPSSISPLKAQKPAEIFQTELLAAAQMILGCDHTFNWTRRTPKPVVLLVNNLLYAKFFLIREHSVGERALIDLIQNFTTSFHSHPLMVFCEFMTMKHFVGFLTKIIFHHSIHRRIAHIYLSSQFSMRSTRITT